MNINYLGLSREMEFQADEVAARTVGYEPIASSLLRLDLASYCFEQLLGYYQEKIPFSIRTQNLYPQHQFMMEFQAKVSKVPVIDHFAQIRIEDLSKYNKSRLVIKDQWASHPGISERIENVKKYPSITTPVNRQPANTLFANAEHTESMLTNFLFDGIHYPDTIQYQSTEDFSTEYENKYQSTAFSDMFNSYYDNKNPGKVNIDLPPEPNEMDYSNATELFTSEYTDLVYTILSMEGDMAQIKQFKDAPAEIQTFDYNGKRYQLKDCEALLKEIEAEWQDIKDQLLMHDHEIHSYFYFRSQKTGLNAEYLDSYKAFRQFDNEYDEKTKAGDKVFQLSAFVYITTPYEKIQSNLLTLGYAEEEFKLQIRTLMEDERFQQSFNGDMRSLFRQYTSKDWVYFEKDTYDTKALDLMFNCLDRYNTLLNKTFIRYKKALLEVMEQIEQSA